MLPPLACNGCRKCCEGDEIELLLKGDPRLKGRPADNPSQFKTRKRADGAIVLARGKDGNCAYLGPTGCTIQARKPRMCRAYDCRLHALAVQKMTPEMQAERMGMASVREGFKRLREAA